tara:strand:- start:1560 stop:1778 length:219 start_codon:yes stop_codon:yes gene_type:complete
MLSRPQGLAIDSLGNLYITDAINHVIRLVSNTGIITIIAGTGNSGFSGDRMYASLAMFWQPTDITLDTNGGF